MESYQQRLRGIGLILFIYLYLVLFFFEDFLSTPWCCSLFYHICFFHLFNFFLLLYFCLLMDTFSSFFIHSLPLLLHFYPPIYCLLICYHLLSFLLACLDHPSYFRLYLPFSSHPTLPLTFFFLPLPLVHLAIFPAPPCSPSSCPISLPSSSLPFSTSTATLLRYYNYYYHFFIYCSSLLSI